MKSVLLRAYPRLHVTLVDTARSTAFSPGGIGLSVAAEPAEIVATEAADILLAGFEHLGGLVRQQCTLAARRTLDEIQRPGISLRLLNLPPQHHGYGSKTLLLSSIVTAICECWAVPIPIPARQRLTGRGGTSGVGLHTFFQGGLVLDGGRPSEGLEGVLPSAAATASSLPLCISRWEFPSLAILLVTVSGELHSGQREVDIFRREAGISVEDLGHVLAALHHGFIPGLLGGNLSIVAQSLSTIHRHGFKAAELRAQSETVQETYGRFVASGLACGMSSMGPLLYVLASHAEREDVLSMISREPNVLAVRETVAWNAGYQVEGAER